METITPNLADRLRARVDGPPVHVVIANDNRHDHPTARFAIYAIGLATLVVGIAAVLS